jgi:TM2 domain-containing membrane protein YozV
MLLLLCFYRGLLCFYFQQVVNNMIASLVTAILWLITIGMACVVLLGLIFVVYYVWDLLTYKGK